MKKSIIASVFILTIIFGFPVLAKIENSSSTSFTKSTNQETITFVDSIKPITEKERNKAIRRAKSIQKQMDQQIRRGRIVPVTRQVVLPGRDDGVLLALEVEFVGNISEEAQETVINAFEIATERIVVDEENDNRTMRVRIVASASALENGVLATASVPTRPLNGMTYPSVLGDYLSNENDIQGFDVRITYSWRRPPAPWYYGQEEECDEVDQMHFGAVIAHEFGHGLGVFSKTIVEDGNGRFVGNQRSFYDFHLVDGEGNSIIENYEEGEELGEILTSDNIFWEDDIRIYAPNEWDSGSSLDHLHTDYYGGDNELMTPFLGAGHGFNWQAGPFYWRILAANGDGWPITEEEEEENRSPIIREEIMDIEIDEDSGEREIVDLDDVFTDPDEDDLVFRVQGDEVLNLNVDDNTNILTINPDHNFYTEGSLEVLVTASDGEEEVGDTFAVTINSVNDDPQWLEFPDEEIIVTEGGVIEFILAAQDEVDRNNDLLIVLVDRGGLPGEGQDFLEDNGQGLANFRWQTGLNHHGEYNPTFQVIDNENGFSEEITITIIVRKWMVPLVRPSW